MRRSLALLILLPGLCLAAPAALDCPRETRLDKVKKANEALTIESCLDLKTRLREGPMRAVRVDGFVEASGHYRSGKLDGEYLIFGDDGRAELRLVYDNGRMHEEKLTRVGLERLLERMNADAEKRDKHWRVSIVDDRTMNFTVRIPAPYSWIKPDEQELRARLIREPALCALFRIPADLGKVLVHYTDADGDDLGGLTVLRTDCTADEQNPKS